MKLTNDTYLILISSAGSARETSRRVVMPWPWNRRSSARRSRQRRLLTDNAKAATARSAAVGTETSSPAISVDLIGAGYGGIVPKTLRPTRIAHYRNGERALRVRLRLVRVPRVTR